MRENHEIPWELQELVVSDIVEKQKGYYNPVIVTFLNGDLSDRHAAKCRVTFHANNNGETNIQVKTSSGHVFKDSGISEKPRPKQILAVRNKKNNKVRLVEVDYGVLMNCALLAPPKQEASSPAPGKELKTLNQTFGGKKIVNRLIEKEKLNLSSLPIADDVQKAVADIRIEGNTSLKNTGTSSILDLLPPCNRDASVVSDLYKMSNILSESELQSLMEEISKEEPYFNSNDFSPFIMNCYSEVKDSQKDVKMAGLLYVETLIRFLKIPSKKLNSKAAVLCPFSRVIQEKILREFCVKTETSVTRPLTMRDKILCHIIALALICCDYQINLKLLATSTSVQYNKLIRLAQVVGAVSTTKVGLFVLKMPLPPLPTSAKRKPMRN